jgi:drug/metabolite transporter (DMT)-like permease
MGGAVACWAVYTVIAKRLAESDQIVVIAATAVIGVGFLAPLAGIELGAGPWPRPSPQAWAAVLFLGIVASAIAFVVYSRVLRQLEASLVGALFNLDPIVGVLTSVLLLGETLALPQIAGGAVALLGMWLAADTGSSEGDFVIGRDERSAG